VAVWCGSDGANLIGLDPRRSFDSDVWSAALQRFQSVRTTLPTPGLCRVAVTHMPATSLARCQVSGCRRRCPRARPLRLPERQLIEVWHYQPTADVFADLAGTIAPETRERKRIHERYGRQHLRNRERSGSRSEARLS